MFKSTKTTGALIPFVCRHGKPEDRPMPYGGAEEFMYVSCKSHATFTERTMTIKSSRVSPGSDDGKFNVTIEIPRSGDLVHTLVLVAPRDAGEIKYDSYELRGVMAFPQEGEQVTYREGMSYAANEALAIASNRALCEGCPLMLPLTTDPYQNHLPLLMTGGNTEDGILSCFYVVVKGVPTKELAEALKLNADFVYFESDTRKAWYEDAKRGLEMPRMARDFRTIKKTVTVDPDSGIATLRLADVDIHKKDGQKDDGTGWQDINTVTGVMMRCYPFQIEEVGMFINGHEFAAWNIHEDNHSSWQKIGLESSLDMVMMPFSRNAWANPERAAFLDLSRIDIVSFKFRVTPGCEQFDVELTALSHKISVYDAAHGIMRTVW